MASYDDNMSFKVKKRPDGWLRVYIKDFHAFGDGFLHVCETLLIIALFQKIMCVII
jgi:hypothetical protein